MNRAIVMEPNDNVATLLSDVQENDIVLFQLDEEPREEQVKEAIGFGHKFALKRINKGEDVVKYAQPLMK